MPDFVNFSNIGVASMLLLACEYPFRVAANLYQNMPDFVNFSNIGVASMLLLVCGYPVRVAEPKVGAFRRIFG